MSFVSIRKKLINQVRKILVVSFLMLITAVTAINLYISKNHFAQAELYIKESLAAKANLLVINNGQALIGMAEDYAFTAVKELVISTVTQDPDIAYGIFMDDEQRAWVVAGESYNENVATGKVLTDPLSQWAAQLTESDYSSHPMQGQAIVEYAAPVLEDGEILGTIRYGVSTAATQIELQEASSTSRAMAIYVTVLLLCLAALAIFFGVSLARRMANTLTRPLAALTQSASVIAQGQYDSDIQATTNDEIGLLAQNFDEMRQTIRQKMDVIEEQNRTLEPVHNLLSSKAKNAKLTI